MTVSTHPSSSRLYWICQAAGWGGFLGYALVAYLLTTPVRRGWDVADYVLVNGVLCPILTHGLRRVMHERGWLSLPSRQLLLRLSAVVVTLSAGITVFVMATARVIDGAPIPREGVIALFFVFCWAFAGWLIIYYVVHVRRRRDALQLELTTALREAQLQSLRAQLNPHFLFNCLNSLRHLIATNPPRAADMVTGLADLLRYSLASDQKETVALADELAIVDEYLSLEQVRLEERLHVERLVDPAALRARIPPMLVQTLVENAIKHGISDRLEGGTVRIDARAVGSPAARVEIVVTNSGRLKAAGSDPGYGLRNARERLRLLYNADASLVVHDEDGRTRATVTLPFVLELADERAAG